MNLLTLNDIVYKYPDATKNVLNGISIKFERGKVYGIMGKSGAGKSTLMSLISGLGVPTSGSVLYNNTNLEKVDKDSYRAKNIGVIFQGYNLLTNATAVENIVLSMHISKTSNNNKKNTAYALLEGVGIDKDKANRKILKLSGGEQQRVGIARALSHNPDIIIADEPTGNLDDETQKKILDILISLAHNDNKCVIIVTHSKKVASQVDELYGLKVGKLLFVK